MISDTFCTDPIWDSNSTWNTKKPKLTKCLAQVGLTIVPSAVLLLLSLIEIKLLLDSKNKRIPLNSYNVTRSLICLLAIYSNFVLFLSYLTSSDDVFFVQADLFGSLIKLVLSIVLASIYHYHRIKGIITSGILFTLLLINTSCSFILLLDTLLYNTSMYAGFEKNNIGCLFLCNFCLLVLSFFTDNSVQAGLKPSNSHQNEFELRVRSDSNSKQDETPQISPNKYCSFISRISFFWYNPLIMQTRKRETKMNEIFQLEPGMKTNEVVNEFNEEFYKELERLKKLSHITGRKKKFGSLNLLKVLWRTCRGEVILIIVLKTLADLSRFAIPFLLHFAIKFLNDPTEPRWHGIFLIIGFILSSSLCSVFTNFSNLNSFRVAINIRTALSNMVFHKSLRLSPTAKRKRTQGQIQNLFVVDSSRWKAGAPFFVYFFSSPFQIIIGFSSLYWLLGNATFFTLIAITLIMMSQYFANRFREKFITFEMKHNDSRLMLINEVLSGIRIIKFSAWEQAFMDRINVERRKQVRYLKYIYYMDMLINWIFFSFSPFVILTTTFAIYIFFIDPSQFTSQKAWVAISIINIIEYPIEELPGLVSRYFNCKVSLERLSSFFDEEELENYVKREYNEKLALSIRNKAKFVWERKDENDNSSKVLPEPKKRNDFEKSMKSNGKENEMTKNNEIKSFELKNIEVEVEKGSFVAVIGGVGSGKSSLISAILGEMHQIENGDGLKGDVCISNDQNICYVAQQAWIQNNTVKNNILFEKSLNEQIYKKVINACALEEDLKQFEAGDETEIGEKGINCSGGQKQRISLARACYFSLIGEDNNQIVLLDDPLSAVDANVCKHLCENVLNSKTGLLRDKTRILVTNQLNQLSNLDVDQIILLKQGEIVLKCTYDELMEKKRTGELDEYDLKLIQNDNGPEEEDRKIKDDKNCHDENIKFQQTNKPLIEKEKREQGNVKFRNYLTYFKYFGLLNATFALTFMISQNYFQIYSRVYLANWTELKLNTTDSERIKISNRDHLLGFSGLILIDCILNIVANLFIVQGILSAIDLFHKHLLSKVLKSKINWFDTTPLGRILNRFNHDIEAIDEQLPLAMREFTVFLLRLLANILLLIVKQPNSLRFYLIIFGLYYFIMKLYINAARIMQRYESTTKSPIYSKLSESLNGISTIRAYSKMDEFEDDLRSRIDVNTRCYWQFLIINRWLKFNLDAIANFIILIVIVQFLFDENQNLAGYAGLLITYALELTKNLNFLIRYMGMFETNAISIERINEYCQNEQEEDETKTKLSPPADWPQNGEIEFKNYSTRYREDTNLILKNLSFKVEGMEKIGICGRTGAGKSTITLALFRIIDPVEGKILIDNIDISQIGLYDLRSKLSIITQDPVLFTGTIRFNLDPFNKYTDTEIYQSLEHAHLKSYVNKLADGINHQIAEDGENFSVGQRQLICLARALLKKSKILVLDEATASVDFTTDELVQKTIKSEFEDCTMVTIAHRLNTIIDASRILVLDKGELLEYDKPEKLLKNPDSFFYSMAAKANIV